MNHASHTTRRLLGTGATAAAISALMLAAPAAATGGFQGTANVVNPGTATVFQNPAADTVVISAPQAVINWRPDDTTGTGTIDFLPQGNVVNFIGTGDYVVLNRIIPVDGSNVPIARLIALNGQINATNGAITGGSVWFYSPGGILVGQNAAINVGSLVLSSRDIDTTGGLFGAGGEIRFRDPGLAGANSAAITIAPGATITTTSGGPAGSNFVALVAPRIEQAGRINADGSVALVAAEVAAITFNQGLFDMNGTVGSSDGNGIVHTGTTGGPSDNTATYARNAYLVAVPKNQAMTMLLSGTVGYETVSTLTIRNGAIVLSAGRQVESGLLGAVGPGTGTTSISMADTRFLNSVTAQAEGSITARPTCHFAVGCGVPGVASLFEINGDGRFTARDSVDFSVG